MTFQNAFDIEVIIRFFCAFTRRRQKNKKKIKVYQSSKGISETVAEFIANFLIQIVTKRGQKLILEYNFKNKISDDFYVIQL